MGGVFRPYLLLFEIRFGFMKKFILILSAILVLSCTFSVVPAFSADSDFVIEDGVLLSYNGKDTTVTIPSSVNVIADKVFSGNTAIKTVALHSNLYSIGNEAFKDCTSLEKVSGADNVNYVGALAFANTKFLTKSTDEFCTLGSVLISYNGKSQKVILPDSVKTISAYAFLRNKTIASFVSGSNLCSIGEGAFYECTALSELEVSENLTFVGADAFKSTKWLSSQSDYVTIGDGLLIAYKGTSTVVNIPLSVKSISPNAFYANKKITSVNLSSSVYSIGSRAFMDCSNLSQVNFNNGLVMIDDEAFAKCVKLNKITTGSNLSLIGEGAFMNCAGLESVSLCGNNLNIGYGAFAYCTSLNTVMMSKDIASVTECAFAKDSSLEYVTIPPQIISVNKNSFDGCDKLTVVCEADSFAYNALSDSFSVSHKIGDADTDGSVTVIDATAVQMHLANKKTLSQKGFAHSDVDYDGTVSVLDATNIQQIIAGLIKK